MRKASNDLGLLAAGLLILAVLLAGCDAPRPQVSFGGSTMGTSYSVLIVQPQDELDLRGLAKQVDDALASINRMMSTYDPQSDLSRFNALRTTDWVEIPAEVLTVLREAQRISEMSGGAFDVTVGPLVNLWGFGPVEPRGIPSKEAVAAVLAQVGHDKLKLRDQPPAMRKTVAGLQLDLSAIAKGYAVDRLAGILDSAGVANYLVEIGGELRARGLNRRGEPWRIGVETPSADLANLARPQATETLRLFDGAIATSGDYRNFMERDGRRYSHTIDPQTGSPVEHDLASVSVLADTCMTADGLATALNAMGSDRARALARRERLSVLLIERRPDGGFATWWSPELTRRQGN